MFLLVNTPYILHIKQSFNTLEGESRFCMVLLFLSWLLGKNTPKATRKRELINVFFT